MTTNRKFSQGKPLMPPTQMITVVATDSNPIDTSDTTLLTLPQLVVGHGPVFVTATINLTLAIAGLITFKLFRGGAEIDATHRYIEEFVRTAGPKAFRTMHWIDESPGAKATYSLVAIAAAGNTNTYDVGSRLSAML